METAGSITMSINSRFHQDVSYHPPKYTMS